MTLKQLTILDEKAALLQLQDRAQSRENEKKKKGQAEELPYILDLLNL